MSGYTDRIPEITARLRETAERIDLTVDAAIYERHGRDPREPVLLGSGDLTASLGIFGRDPGATEIELAEPFIGSGGQLVRKGLAEALGLPDSADDPRRIDAGGHVFWANTVPYKPVGNKAWSVTVRRRFRPIIADLLANHWQGRDLLTLGNNAFFWFGLDDRLLMQRLTEFWEREDRYEAKINVALSGREITLYPLPHPSPLNARWFKAFPGLLRARLSQIGWPPR